MSVLNSFLGYIFPRLHVKMFVCEASTRESMMSLLLNELFADSGQKWKWPTLKTRHKSVPMQWKVMWKPNPDYITVKAEVMLLSSQSGFDCHTTVEQYCRTS